MEHKNIKTKKDLEKEKRKASQIPLKAVPLPICLAKKWRELALYR